MNTFNFLFGLVIVCTAVWTARGGCTLITSPFIAVHQRSDNEWEKCFVDVDICFGDCYTSYEHRPHLDEDFTNADDNCYYSYRHCIVDGSTSTEMRDLSNCSPFNSQLTSEFDAQNPWQVETVNALTCTCSSAVTGDHDASDDDATNGHCPPPSLYI